MTSHDDTTRRQVAWLARRAGWGLAPGELDRLSELGTDAVIDLLVDPDTNGIGPEPSAWEGFVESAEQDDRRDQSLDVLDTWVRRMIDTTRPFENSMTWFWHDHFAVSYEVVNRLTPMIDHLELLRRSAFGSFAQLIRDVTVDAAMLVFLDGTTSTGESPNENYGRELQELYTLGVGNYTEDDVRAAAVALTGWVVARRRGGQVFFLPRRHDPTPQTFLGVEGINDVDGVVDTIMAHPAVPGFIAAKTAGHFLGPVDGSVVTGLADTFAAADLEIRPLARAVLEAGVDGATTPQVTAPVPWTVAALKATGADMRARAVLGLLRMMGQVPGLPPNVGGYPGASTWLASSSTAGRFTMANAIARETPDDAPILAAAAARDFATVADLLVRPEGFGPATLEALAAVPERAAGRPGEAALAVALASPDFLIR